MSTVDLTADDSDNSDNSVGHLKDVDYVDYDACADGDEDENDDDGMDDNLPINFSKISSDKSKKQIAKSKEQTKPGEE